MINPISEVCQQFQLNLREIGYDKEILLFKSPLEAIQFLKSFKSSEVASKAANLIFYSYSLKKEYSAVNLLKLTKPELTRELDEQN